MRPNSTINTVHTARLGKRYGRVARYLRKHYPDGRRVYNLTKTAQSITFQSECLIPRKERGRPRVLLLFSNPHPGSIQKGMFHSAERRVANLWADLRGAGLFSSEDALLKSPDALRGHCLNVQYDGPFTFGFACYWFFPTSYPRDLKSLFGKTMEPPSLEDPNVRHTSTHVHEPGVTNGVTIVTFGVTESFLAEMPGDRRFWAVNKGIVKSQNTLMKVVGELR